MVKENLGDASCRGEKRGEARKGDKHEPTKRAQNKGKGSHAEANAVSEVSRAELCDTVTQDTG